MRATSVTYNLVIDRVVSTRPIRAGYAAVIPRIGRLGAGRRISFFPSSRHHGFSLPRSSTAPCHRVHPWFESERHSKRGPCLVEVATEDTGRESSTAAVNSGRKITEAEALRARRDMVCAQHQVGWALDRLCELDGARWVYDSDELGAIRRDVMTILTHHAASRRAAMAPYGRLLLTRAG
jgi:hypothetical protein